MNHWEFLSNLMTLFYFDTFTHTVHVPGIYHPSSGATLQIGAVGITTNGSVLRPVGCHIG
jgi:hypothetical protein